MKVFELFGEIPVMRNMTKTASHRVRNIMVSFKVKVKNKRKTVHRAVCNLQTGAMPMIFRELTIF